MSSVVRPKCFPGRDRLSLALHAVAVVDRDLVRGFRDPLDDAVAVVLVLEAPARARDGYRADGVTVDDDGGGDEADAEVQFVAVRRVAVLDDLVEFVEELAFVSDGVVRDLLEALRSE